MTKPDATKPPTAWGTWEELLLAFAVNRHGTAAWDSIAADLRKRTPDTNLSLTAHNCRLKYIDLKRRFVSDFDPDDKSNVDESVPLLEELRKLRVAELRREVQRYDLNIESLELKMKEMEEERERNSRRENSETDLGKKSEEKDEQPEPATVRESDKDQLSVNESNSTDPGGEKQRTGEKVLEPAGEEERKSEEAAELKHQKSDSCNGSSNSIEEPDRKAKSGPATELVESEAESEGARAKENSDVQSSASRSRKEEGNDKMRRGTTSGDEVKESTAESQPLVDFLQAIRAHKLGSMFERRLRTQQESLRYEKLILQHVDIGTLEGRLKEGWYSEGQGVNKLFRDVLVMVNNALVFFPKDSLEAKAAIQVRGLVAKERANKDPLISKPRTLIVCRKRSSIAAKDKEAEEPKITKKRTRDRFPAPAPAPAPAPPPPPPPTNKNNAKTQLESPSSQHSDPNKNSKKRGAANFLNRMKTSNNGDLLDALKNTPLTTDTNTKASTSKKKEAPPNNTKKPKDKGPSPSPSLAKRNVGRPPKRGAPTPPPPGKRGRDRAETETKQPKKRSRKL